MEPDFIHRPVLLREVLEGLSLKPGAVVLDATVGLGGHAEGMLRVMGPSGRLIGMDRDGEALALAKKRLSDFGDKVTFIHRNFGELGTALDQAGWRELDAALFDLGLSSMQLDKAERGFSFSREGPLDMRMDPDQEITAAHLVNHLSPRELEDFIRNYGEERWAGRVARVIVRSRPFSSTLQLAEAIRGAVPAGARHGRIDPATRTFQAVRMAVNREQEELSSGLPQAIQRLKSGGRIAVLSYHSLEDRIVKNCFRTLARAGVLKRITRKPLRPSEAEVAENPRSRSAILRVAERVR